MASEPLLELKKISKGFPGVQALSRVDFMLRPGEIAGLCGENGAGKSTLIKILGGVHQPDSGTIEIMGRETVFEDARRAIATGISIIYQELSLVPGLSVAENIYMGKLPIKCGVIDFKKLYKDAERVLALLGQQNIKPKQKVSELSISSRQLVEIAKALARDAKILIMDEPTSSLGTQDSQKLFETMRKLRQEGYGIIFVSHRLDELLEVCDRISVLRDGYMVSTGDVGEWTQEELVLAMVNRKIEQLYPKRSIAAGRERLTVQGLENQYIKNVSFTLHSGEILGIAGLVGSGRTELLKMLYGVDPACGGTVTVDGCRMQIDSPQRAMEAGFAFVPEDRRAEALIMESSVEENVILSVLRKISNFRVVGKAAASSVADCAIKYFNIKTPSRNQKVMNLSGGNQQKTVFARIAERQPKILLLDEPIRGVDIGSKVEIYNRIMDFAENGAAILLASSELTEIIGLSDRILVMNRGSMVAQLETAKTDSKQIMDYAAGGRQREADAEKEKA